MHQTPSAPAQTDIQIKLIPYAYIGFHVLWISLQRNPFPTIITGTTAERFTDKIESIHLLASMFCGIRYSATPSPPPTPAQSRKDLQLK